MFAAPLETAIVPVTPFQQNCTILWCTKTMAAAVIDPGGHLDRVRAMVRQRGVTLEKILITHAHRDHAGSVAELAESESLPIEGPHIDDQFWIDKLADAKDKPGFDTPRPFTPTRWLEGHDTVSVGELTLDIRHCPGHTPGHIVFFHEPSQLAIVGDVLFRGTIGRTDLPRGDRETLIRSITEQLWPLGDDVMFLPGHGRLSTFGRERRDNPFVADHVLAQGGAPVQEGPVLGPTFE
jgi:glyoxylase-like metal-dependent hydrolase (beta-lactamase superfamily II)